ncbi:hypothetical protein [Halalkalibacter flavus]|jgi:hypothetical protein|uniref:hypothetical protein n=1 Tax=Halalkalibacter flavus TaxID=3090668 RepID=UPI002FC937B4
MKHKEVEERIVGNFQRDEHMMILVFAQWCVNHDLDPASIYGEAYPNQTRNPALQQAIELTVPKNESEEIPDETLLGVLSLFGNEDLAFVVTQEIKKRKQ